MFAFNRLRVFAIRNKKSFSSQIFKRYCVKYVQGQSPEPRVREYFYYIDHQGMLFLDDSRMKNFTSCFKDKKFLAFFFKHLKQNDTGRYMKDFPYISLCGPERNFVRCDDLPIVFTKILQKENNETGKNEDWFGYAHAEELLMVPFEPKKLYMNQSGRIYHPAPKKAGGIGLVRSKIAIELSSSFNFEEGEEKGPTHFFWKDKMYTLDCNWFKDKILLAIR
ncbi:UPF0598 protein CG30010 [Apis mellifera]|uniref:UPF0598 protein CG30010 n=1 Tax=Apis mellifera TaxID=7460 RepID=A0A7M7R7M0_APIME|nr:UPF0598 protein CG30010 [Apis mellifera]|eukprot:XP_393829.3 UPF0598 protein CG30010 [Apis mellifera]